MKDFTHIPQLWYKGRASNFAEGSASPSLKRASPQYLSMSNTLGNGLEIQALLLSSFVCDFAEEGHYASKIEIGEYL